MNAEKKKIHFDRVITLFLFVCILCCAASRLHYDCLWGDDYAAYLNEAIAIVDGTFDEQIRYNYQEHLTGTEKEKYGEEGEWVYVWGYPLLQTVVYRLAGFDRVSFRSILFYKIPLVLSLSFSAVLLYRWFRRRLSCAAAIVLSVWICLSMLDGIDLLYSDLFFFFLFCACLVLAEGFLDSSENGSGLLLPYGIALGLAMLATYETRLNGIAVCVLAAMLQASRLVCKWRDKPHGRGKALLVELLPWAVFGGGLLFCRFFVLRPASSNMSDYSKSTLESLLINTRGTLSLLASFLTTIPGLHTKGFGSSLPANLVLGLKVFVPAGLILWGLAKSLRRDSAALPHLLFGVGYLVFLIMLPYSQGLRYCYPVLPVIMLYLGVGAEAAAGALARRIKEKPRRLLSGVCLALSLGMLINASIREGEPHLFRVLRGEDVRGNNWYSAYSTPALVMWRYIRENTPEDSVILFVKHRGLYLNTERKSLILYGDEKKLPAADYYLDVHWMGDQQEKILTERGFELRPDCQVGRAILYRILGEERTPSG